MKNEKVVEIDKKLAGMGDKIEELKHKVVEMSISSPADYKTALNLLMKIYITRNDIESRRQFFVKPLYDQMREKNEYFNKYLKPLEEVESLLRQKIIEYRKVLKSQFEEEFVSDFDPDLPIEITPVLSRAEAVAGGEVTFRKVKKWVIEDESKLPREFLKPDEKKIAEAVKKNQEIPGVKVYTEEEIAIKTL